MPILSGLHAIQDIQADYGMGHVAVVQAGLVHVKDHSMVVGECDPFEGLPSFTTDNVRLDPYLTDDTWEPQAAFRKWVFQLANALGKEHPQPCPPWVPEKWATEEP